MAPYGLTSDAKSEFLTNSEAIDVPSNIASPNVFCQHKCLAKRNSRDDYESCNGYIYEDNQCKVNYMAPEWIVEQSKSPGSSSIAYFDVIVP